MSKLQFPANSHLEALVDRINSLGRAAVVNLIEAQQAGATEIELVALQRALMVPIDALQDDLISELGFCHSRRRVQALRAVHANGGTLQ